VSRDGTVKNNVTVITEDMVPNSIELYPTVTHQDTEGVDS
jgi:hypothetical protein